MSSRPSQFTLTGAGPLRLFSTQELLNRPIPPWFIDGIFPSGGLVSIYGPPGGGKSFIAMDMALSCATGRAWQGRPTEPGFVLYIAAEGGAGIGKRARAWIQHHRASASSVRLGWATEPLALFKESQDLDTLTDRLSLELECAPAFIIIDTLARCFEGDENTQLDMGRFVAGCDALRTEYAATVLVVHHTRLDGERERGNTAFRGSLDTLIEVKPNHGMMDLICRKQKDAEDFATFSLRLQPVPGTESCVVVDETFDTNQYTLLGALLDHTESQPWTAGEIIDLMKSLHQWSERKTFYELRCSRKSRVLLRKNDEYILNVQKSK